MTRRRVPAVLGAVVFGLVASAGAFGQSPEPDRQPRFKPGVFVEYFSRTIASDGDSAQTMLKTGFGGLRFETRISNGLSFGVLAGYGFSNANGLVFRDLPFSIDYEAGAAGGFLAGADVHNSFIRTKKYEIEGLARFVAYFGGKKQVGVTNLNLPGGVDARGTWMRVQAGPVLRYFGSEDLSPFISLFVDRLWGTYTVNETIFDLTGTEEKKISGKGWVRGSFGITYSPYAFFSLEAEVTALPYNKVAGGLNFDYGGSVVGIFSF